MNRFNWTYLADNGKQHHVGIMHGAQSGHLLVYCNLKIIIIDFQVLEDAQYTFFIEEELCELTIERRGNQFLYGFEVNQQADTPLNRQRKKRERKHMLQSLLFLGGFIVFLTLLVSGITRYHGNKDVHQLSHQLEISGQEVHARILNIPSEEHGGISYFFTVNGNAYSTHTTVSYQPGPFLLQTGMPLQIGDEFMVRYLPSNPNLCEIDFTQPTANTLKSYKTKAVQEYIQQFPNLSPEYCNCLVDIAFDLNGIRGYADLYFMNTSPQENPHHNSRSFTKLTGDQPFKKLLKEKCSNSN